FLERMIFIYSNRRVQQRFFVQLGIAACLIFSIFTVKVNAQEEVAATENTMSYTGEPGANFSRAAASTSTDVFNIGDSTRPPQDAVDVSSYQGEMTQSDYKILADKGVRSVVVKTTQSSNYTNPYALEQIEYAANAGLNVNLYHYANFATSKEAKAEANYLLSFLKENNLNKKVMIFADMEDPSTENDNVASSLNDFWKVLSDGGYENHGVYTGAGYLYRSAVSNTVGAENTWMAQYPYEPSGDDLWQTNYGAWQFTPTAKVPNGDYTGYLDVSSDYIGLFEKGAGTQPFN
ncbi:MAG: glycoside hydrolase family 25, partial [Tetragenococcus koreensis]|nr:glycoside hydrolase family 25 [Tetragenococcus koreensis]